MTSNTMNKIWTRYNGLVLTNWNVGEHLPLNESNLILSIISSIRTGDGILFNDKQIFLPANTKMMFS